MLAPPLAQAEEGEDEWEEGDAEAEAEWARQRAAAEAEEEEPRQDWFLDSQLGSGGRWARALFCRDQEN